MLQMPEITMTGLHDTQIKEFECQTVATNALEVEPCCEVASAATQRDVVEMDHPEVLAWF